MKPPAMWAALVCALVFLLIQMSQFALAQGDDTHGNPLGDDRPADLNAETPVAPGNDPPANTTADTPVNLEDKVLDIDPRNSLDQPARETPSFGWTAFKVFGTLAVLLALLVGGIWAMKRFMPGAPQLGGSALIQILARTRVSPAQSVMLLRVGQRGLVLGVSGGEIRTLAQINDQQELDVLTAQSAAAATQSISQTFRDIFRRHETEFDAKVDAGLDEERQMEDMEHELSEIRRRIETWTGEEDANARG